jgi:ferritin-like metal-binding protein YciE
VLCAFEFRSGGAAVLLGRGAARADIAPRRTARALRAAARRGGLAPSVSANRAGVRAATTSSHERGAMATATEQLVKHIDEAYAMEQNVLRMLDGMIKTTDDAEMRQDLERHKTETQEHAARLKQRLGAHGSSPSIVREAGGILGALMKGVVDIARSEHAGRNARDGYATEHMEIASYQLLERVAARAGDDETAEVARRNRADEEAMARRIEQTWDKVTELSLREESPAA